MEKSVGIRIGLIFYLFLLISTTLEGAVYLTREEALKIAFPDTDTIEKEIAVVTKEKKEKIKELLGTKKGSGIYEYYMGKKNGKVTGYARFSDVIGKSLPITFMVVLNRDCSVKMVEILAYRELYGGEVRQKRFLDQFNGKKITDPLHLNSDIRNISSATLSCRAVTDEVRRIVAYMTVLVEPKDIPAEEIPREPEERGLQEKENEDALVSPSLFLRSQLLMGTVLEVELYAGSPQKSEVVFSRIFSEVSRLERLFSTYIEESEISRLNQYAGRGALPINPEVIGLLSYSKDITRRTMGAFDITVGPLCNLWNENAKKNKVPSDREINKAKGKVSADYLEIDREANTAELPAGVKIDLGGIGKGYALDMAGKVLIENGINSALLNFGGNILAIGTPPGKGYWTIYIRDPENESNYLSSIYLKNGAVSTSADYERGLIIQGKRYSHIINPRTGYPAAGMLSVTVVTPTAAEADAFSTAIYALGFEKGLAFAEKNSVATMILGDKKRVFKTVNFRALEEGVKGER